MIEKLKLESYHVSRTQSKFGGDGSFGGGGKSPDNAWGMVEAKLNEVIEAVNQIQSDPNGAVPTDVWKLKEKELIAERQRLTQSIHRQTFGDDQ